MTSNYKKNKKLLNAKQVGSIFFVTPNPNRGIGLEEEIKDYHIICSQKTDLVDCLKNEKISILCLDDDNIKSSGKLLESKKVLDYIKKQSKQKTVNIITFKPSPKIHKICKDNGFRYLGNDWRLNRKLEDKVEFVDITNRLKIPNAKSRIIKIEDQKKFKDKFNFKNKNKYVIQLPRGYSGNSTFLIENKNDLEKIVEKYENRIVKFSKYIEGDAYTLNVCVGNFGIVVSQLIYQITGLTLFNKNQLGTSGNDYVYSERLSSIEKKRIFNYTKKIGKYMAQLGYQGIFGLDLIIDKNDVNLIEINPRFVGSIPAFTKLQLQNQEVSFLFLHLSEFLGLNVDSELLLEDLSYEKWNKQNIFSFSQLVLRNTKDVPIKIVEPMVSGVYKFDQDKLILKNKTYNFKNLNDKEVLVQCLKKNSIVSPDTEYANIQFGYGIIEHNHIKKEYKKIVETILNNIQLK